MNRTLGSYNLFRAMGYGMSHALAYDRAIRKGEARDLRVVWEDEFLPWDGDCPAPKVHLMASVYHPDRPEPCHRGHKHFYVLAHLGSIGLKSHRDPYMRIIEAELLSEALDVLDKEDASEAAILAERATYAGCFT
jgi:hypothetical protein